MDRPETVPFVTPVRSLTTLKQKPFQSLLPMPSQHRQAVHFLLGPAGGMLLSVWDAHSTPRHEWAYGDVPCDRGEAAPASIPGNRVWPARLPQLAFCLISCSQTAQSISRNRRRQLPPHLPCCGRKAGERSGGTGLVWGRVGVGGRRSSSSGAKRMKSRRGCGGCGEERRGCW